MISRLADAPKVPTNLALDGKVLDMAKSLGMNVPETVNVLLAQEVHRVYWTLWQDANQEAMDAYNERIEREGLPLAKYRTF